MQSLTTPASDVRAHAQEFQGFLLERRAFCQHGKACGLVLSRLHHISDQRSQVFEQPSERLNGQSFLGRVRKDGDRSAGSRDPRS